MAHPIAAMTRRPPWTAHDASQLWRVRLHCNKGLAGAAANALARTADTPMNPAVLDSFALAIAAATDPAYPGIAGHEPDLAQGRQQAETVAAAIAPLKGVLGRPVRSPAAGQETLRPRWPVLHPPRGRYPDLKPAGKAGRARSLSRPFAR
jgi:hypothetical protein